MSEEAIISAPASAEPSATPSAMPVDTSPSTAASTAWYGQLPESLAGDQKFFDQFKDQESFMKSAKETKSALSKKMEGYVRLPGENASEDDIAAYHQAIGVPEDPSGYEITAEDAINLPGFDPEALGPIKEAAHSLGLSAQQFEGLVAAQARIEAAQIAEMTHAEQALVNQWGNDFEYKVTDIQQRVGEVLDLDQMLMPRADVLRALDFLAADFRQDSTAAGRASTSVSSIEEQISSIMQSPGYRNGTDKASRERLHGLYREQAAREAATRR
jgi:hypothetical protein